MWVWVDGAGKGGRWNHPPYNRHSNGGVFPGVYHRRFGRGNSLSSKREDQTFNLFLYLRGYHGFPACRFSVS